MPNEFDEHTSLWRADFLDAEAIVRHLAAVEDSTVGDRDYSPSATCGLCGKDDPKNYEHVLDDPAEHEPSCPWRLAREWVAAHPVPAPASPS